MKLTDERIVELWNASAQQDSNYATLIPSFARSIEAELAKGQESVAYVLTEEEQLRTTLRNHVIYIGDLPRGKFLYATPQPCPKCAELESALRSAVDALSCVERMPRSAESIRMSVQALAKCKEVLG